MSDRPLRLIQVGADPYSYRLVGGVVIFVAMYADAIRTKLIAGRRKQIEDGALTPDYELDPDQAIHLLNNALATELVNWREANTAVAEFPRGHVDILRWEAEKAGKAASPRSEHGAHTQGGKP